MARQELAHYLRDRRAALRPHEIGLPETGTARRTPGLRREEVAELAHMSVDYYTRLEQARGPRPSARILDALARALRLTPAERSHLFRLAGSSAPPGTNAVRRVRPHVVRMLDRLPETGAVVTDAAYHVVAWNPWPRHCSAATSETGRRTWPAAASSAGGGRTRAPPVRSSDTSRWRGCAGPPTATRTTRGWPPCWPNCTTAVRSSGRSGRPVRSTRPGTARRPWSIRRPVRSG